MKIIGLLKRGQKAVYQAEHLHFKTGNLDFFYCLKTASDVPFGGFGSVVLSTQAEWKMYRPEHDVYFY